MKALIRRIYQSAVLWSFLATFLRVGASVFVLPLVLRKMPEEHLGLWYVFGTFGGLSNLLDFGFEPTITRMASYAWSGATRFLAFGIHQNEDSNSGAEPNRELLGELVATLRAYYFWVGLGVLFLMAIGGGAWIWKVTDKLPDPFSLRIAWLVYALGCCLNFISGRWPALLAGVGAIKESQHIGILSLLGYYAVAVTGLLTGFGIWGLVGGVLFSGWLGRSIGRHLFKKIAAFPSELPSAKFHREIFWAIWPNAWRMGLVSLGAFCIIQANTLVCSAFLGLKTTASYGISFQLCQMLVGLSGTWVGVKMPQINQLRVRRQNEEIARIFASRIRLTILSYLAGAMCILFLAPAVLHAIGSKTTLLPLGPLSVMALIQFLEMHHAQYANLVFSENYNPFLRPALLSGAGVLLFSVLLTPHLGVWGLLVSAGVVQASFNNWWPILRALRGLEIPPSRFLFEYVLRLR